MRIKICKLLCIAFLFTTTVLKAQNVENVLNTIKQNNLEIQAGKKFVESKSYEYRQENLPEGPELKYGYFPKNSSVPGTKEIFEVSQSFQIPGYYRNQKAYADLMIEKEAYTQMIVQQDVLSKAKQLLIEYVYLRKKAAINEKRLKFAEDTYNAYQVRLEVGDANALEVNKARLHLMQVKKEEKNVRTSILSINERLKALNGGIDIEISVNDYPNEMLVDLDSVIFEKLSVDPLLLAKKKAAAAAEKQWKVTKNLQLPKFSLGYGTETVADESFKGVLVGLSIPLWSSKRAIQKARIKTEYYDLSQTLLNKNMISETKIIYDQVTTLKENLTSYQTVLSSVNNQELLNMSLDSGDISIIEFFTEMFYYYEIYDEYLAVEREYYQELARLYKYKL